MGKRERSAPVGAFGRCCKTAQTVSRFVPVQRVEKYRFGGIGFTSKKAVATHARSVRKKYPPHTPINDPKDASFVGDLFARNVESNEKASVGVAGFFWAKSPQHATECFWVKRSDGSVTEFGLQACLDGFARLNRSALRAAVHEDVERYRESRIRTGDVEFVSDYSGLHFPVAEAEVDHVVPFDRIVDQFFAERGIDLAAALLTAAVDAQSEPVWRDPLLIAEFRTFHGTFRLRLVHSRENQSAIRREQRGAPLRP